MRIIRVDTISHKEKGYLLGLFLGDGYADYNKKDRHYSISFFLNSLKDGDIQENLVKILTKFNLVVNIRKDKRYNVNRIRVRSKLFYFFIKEEKEQLQSLSVNCQDSSFLLGALSGFIDADGYVSKHGGISLAQKKYCIILLMKQICELFDIKCNPKLTRNTPKGHIWRAPISTRFKYLPHNSQKVQRIMTAHR